MSLNTALLKLKNRESLGPEEMAGAMEFVISGQALDGDIEQLLLSLRPQHYNQMLFHLQ